MIRELRIRFDELVITYVAPHWRTPRRLAWLQSLVNLQPVFDRFERWRAYYRYKIMVNSQRLVLEGHLRKTYGPGILIKSYDDGYIGIGLNTEPAHWRTFGLTIEDRFVPLPLNGEGGEEFDGYDFLVFVPVRYDINLIRAEIEKYKMADKKYNIIIK